MKKILISLALISSLIVPTASSAAIKAGESCTKVGATTIQSNKKFTCVKSGKKLIWGKGVATKVSQPVPPTQPVTPAPSSTPVETKVKAGESCQTIGELKENSNGKVECRDLAGDKKIWIQLSNSAPGVVNTVASESVNICKLPDLRTQKTPGQGAAFPLAQAAFSSIGNVRVGVVPIDFPDAQGETNLSEIIEKEKRKVDAWLAFNSQGKQQYKWSILNEWVRAPKSSDTYNWVNPGNPQGVQVLSDAEIANQLFSAASSKIDLSQLDYVFLLFPKEQKGILQEIAGRSKPVTTPKGTFNLSYFGAGKYFVDTKQESWSIWVHEALHSQGLAMHAPGNGSPLHIGGNQSGASSNLSGWDKFISGWLDDSQVFCLQESNIAGQRITLASTDKTDAGYRLGVIKISQSEAIIIESRRKGEFSQGFPAGTYGLNAYVVQTAQNNERCDACNQDEIEKKQFAYYLRADGVERGMFNYPMTAPIRLSVFIREGESVSFKGVKVTLAATGDYDTISITK